MGLVSLFYKFKHISNMLQAHSKNLNKDILHLIRKIQNRKLILQSKPRKLINGSKINLKSMDHQFFKPLEIICKMSHMYMRMWLQSSTLIYEGYHSKKVKIVEHHFTMQVITPKLSIYSDILVGFLTVYFQSG